MTEILIALYFAVSASMAVTYYEVTKDKIHIAGLSSIICGLLWPVFWFHNVVQIINKFLIKHT